MPEKNQDWQRRQAVWLDSLLAQMQIRGFYGRITLVLVGGRIDRVLKEESLKPPMEDAPPPR